MFKHELNNNPAANLTAHASPVETTVPAKKQDAVYQLRVYEIFETNKAAFHERFRDHAMRIMTRYGFDIIALWEAKTDQRTEFVYLIKWPDAYRAHSSLKRWRGTPGTGNRIL